MSLIKETVAGSPCAPDLSWSPCPCYIHEHMGHQQWRSMLGPGHPGFLPVVPKKII